MSEIPDKPYFKIGEVAQLAGVEPYVLRYWETEFRTIRPEKSRSKQRLYRRKDVEAVMAIKKLLYDEGYRIDGAKRRLRELAASEPGEGGEPSASAKQLGGELKKQLIELEKIVDEDERM